ncbi:malonic semialdehyde reductase [Alsobacter sp. SYSU M60028]|uniref:Putative NADH dehydrogenase/NAD(P)H nitroreductase NK718_08805 n=1 Tax=Alsobacter ponti TaxID=2962936 RepID=A0ABT1LAV3_9HYPH|nr:malonic semialdehyde reductase [Alsobacter ponti]MCP8938610.1 malonic semialdehyde reductase [Alsobacter ponti]
MNAVTPSNPRAPLSDEALRQLFLDARTHNAWLDRDVPDELLHRLADLMKLGPTAANSCPARIVFVRSPEAKAKLGPLMSEGNRAKTLAAPVNAIVGYDLRFYEKMGELFPHNPGARGWFEGKPAAIEENGLRNSSLQGAYMILAARALGLDCGPMGGFDRAGIDAAFFPSGTIRSNFVCNLGYGDPAGLRPRLPRLDFEDFCSIV